MNKIYNACEKEMTFEEVLKYIFDEYNLVMNVNQYVLARKYNKIISILFM